MALKVSAWLSTRIMQMRWRKLSVVFALFATSISIFLYWYHPLLLDRIDERSRDIIFSVSHSTNPSDQVAMVVVDEKSIKQFGRWPWPRALQAQLITKLKATGAKVIALDIVYITPTTRHNDDELSSALTSPGPPVVGGYFFREEQTISADDDSIDEIIRNRVSVLKRADTTDVKLPDFSFVEPSHAMFSSMMQAQGFFNYSPDDDGIVRKSQLLLQYDDNIYPSLALQALAFYWGEKPTADLADPYSIVVAFGKNKITLNAEGQLALNFYRGSTDFVTYSASDIAQGLVDASALRDKMIFVGVTETGVADVRPTPVNPSFPGVALHATAVSNILQNNYLVRDKRVVIVDVILMLILPFVLVFLVARVRKLIWQILVGLVSLSVVWWVYYQSVLTTGYLISIVYPTIAMFIAYLSYQSFHNFIANRHARFLREAFANYVSEDLVAQLIQSPEKLKLSGEKRTITILFCDLRDFTSISEKLDPEQLVAIMNDYFDPMTEIIMAHGGTLDKYIGDAIMAIFNAPLDLPNHAQRAVECALTMRKKLVEINQQLQQRYNVQLAFGIGINTGVAVVGNMGSSKRFDYTAMGDAVNLASRVEGQCKVYNVEIIVTDDTRRLLLPKIECRKLDTIQVKGKQQFVEIFTPEM